jgi:hypothetical protein
MLMTKLSLAGEQEFFLKLTSEIYDLHYYQKNSLYSHIYGVYRKHLALTGGINIHLFPNKEFIITTWADIIPEEKIGNGKYIFSQGTIKFEFEYLNSRHSKLKKELNTLHSFWGWIDKGDYVTGHITILVSPDDLDKLTRNNFYYDFYERTMTYYEWRKIHKSFTKDQ